MKKARYLLDTSALAAHFLQAPGDRAVGDCLEKGAAVCALTPVEFAALLKRLSVAPKTAAHVWDLYRDVLADVLAVDEEVAALATQLQRESTDRLPLADACIAACAACHDLGLLHCDRHFEVLPARIRCTDIRSGGA
jgi:predicted nucleic acid-binding protein